jgi:hypothetical protein
MPIHVNQYFRNRELALEEAGLIVKLNSVAYDNLVAAENAGLVGKKPLADIIYYFNGKAIRPKE